MGEHDHAVFGSIRFKDTYTYRVRASLSVSPSHCQIARGIRWAWCVFGAVCAAARGTGLASTRAGTVAAVHGHDLVPDGHWLEVYAGLQKKKEAPAY